MPKTVVFIADSSDLTIEEQRAACVQEGDLVIEPGEWARSFGELADKLKKIGKPFKPGDRLKVYDLAHLNVKTLTLIVYLHKLVASGVTVEIVRPGLTIAPGEGSAIGLFLDELNQHHRYSTTGRTGEPRKGGPKRIIPLDQGERVRAMLKEPGATSAGVAKQLGIARSTLFKYLKASSKVATEDTARK